MQRAGLYSIFGRAASDLRQIWQKITPRHIRQSSQFSKLNTAIDKCDHNCVTKQIIEMKIIKQKQTHTKQQRLADDRGKEREREAERSWCQDGLPGNRNMT